MISDADPLNFAKASQEHCASKFEGASKIKI